MRNLRAMFENKNGDQSTSPPSRGRSPSNSIGSSNSRPVSKVRASFVAVERPADISTAQQWGLRKTSDVSSVAEEKADHTNGILPTSTFPPSNTDVSQSTMSAHTSKESIDGGLGTILKGSSFEGTPTKLSTQSAPEAAIPSSSILDSKPKGNTAPSNVGSRAAEMIKKMQAPGKPTPVPATALITNPGAKPVLNPHPKPMVKPSPVASPRSPQLEKSSPKTPNSPAGVKSFIKGGPAKIKGVMESAKQASEAREAMKKEAENKTVTKKEPVQQPKPKVNGVKKDAVSSPAMPTASLTSPTTSTKLPAAATATTAAITARRDTQPVTQQPAKRSTPRASLPVPQSRATAATAASALHKKSSRASLAPNGSGRPTSRVSLSKPDESFLARMTRPTQSSAQKTHEKFQTNSPPRAKVAPSKAPRRDRTSAGTGKSDQSDSRSAGHDNVDEANTTVNSHSALNAPSSTAAIES